MRHCVRITAVAGAAARFEVIDLLVPAWIDWPTEESGYQLILTSLRPYPCLLWLTLHG